MCFHDAIVVDERGVPILRNYCSSTQKEFSTLEDLLKANFMPTCSVLVRNQLFGEVPDWFYEVTPMDDWPIHIFNAQHGKIGYINVIMGAYRRHSMGVWSGLRFAHRLQLDIRFYHFVNAYLNYQYDDLIQSMLSDRWNRLATEFIEQGFQLGLEQVSVNHVKKIFINWPVATPYTNEWKTTVLARIYERLLFASYSTRRSVEARYCLVKLVQFQPSCLQNQGVRSIAVDMILGHHLASRLKRFVKNSSQK